MRVTAPARQDAQDEDWLAEARAGEAWALERLYMTHYAAIRALCHRILLRTEDAEDAAQATFVNAFQALPGFAGRCAIKTWLYRIAVNQSISLLRQRTAAPLPLNTEMPAPDGPDGASAVTERVAVHAALERLSPEHRAVLVLRFWEELSYGEMTAVLSVPMPTLKMRLFRAKRDFLRAWEDGEP